MAEKSKSAPPFDLRTAAVVMAVMGGLYLVPSALRSSRPSEKEALERTSRGDQVVPARLWQDPLEAAKNYRDKMTNGSPEAKRATLEELGNQILRQSKQIQAEHPKETNVTVLQVMISGGSYAEDAETRHRARYAVLSALGVAGYVPYDEEHIGYAEVQWPRGVALHRFATNQIPRLFSPSMTNDSFSERVLVPFEWFQQSELQPPSPNASAASRMILVLWLRADAFDDHPAKRLAQLMWELQQKVKYRVNEQVATKPPRKGTRNLSSGLDGSVDQTRDSTNTATCKLNFKLLDPRLHYLVNDIESSALTKAMSHEDLSESFSIQEAFGGMEVYSTYATTADTLLKSDFTGRRRQKVKTYLQDQLGLNFVNATCTDDELAAAICDELKRRGVDMTERKNCVALISEWDTFYGRALPFTFAAEVLYRQHTNLYTNRSDAIMALKTNMNIDLWPSNIFRYTYLRGVDGKLPGEEPHKADVGKNTSKTKEGEEPDRPEGHSQLDYMPRLADTIENLERWFQHSGRGELKAIGILGSDVYDKLLVLQTLRPHFTDELFFTTDLDARLLHPTEQKWARNVIVASSFGLKLNWKRQGTTPPFRDTAQTGQYLATLAAGGKIPSDYLDELSPRLFEIGRSGAYDLTVEYKGGPSTFAVGDIKDMSSFATKLKQRSDAVSTFLSSQFAGRTLQALAAYSGPSTKPEPLQAALAKELNKIIKNQALYDAQRFAGIRLRLETQQLQAENPQKKDWARLNRLLLEDAYPQELSKNGANIYPARLNTFPGAKNLFWYFTKNNLWVLPLIGLTLWLLLLFDPTEGKWREVFPANWTGGKCWCVAGGAALLPVVVLVEGLSWEHVRLDGEPFSLVEGISIWPTEIIRLCAAALSAFFFFKTRHDLMKSKDQLSDDYGLPARLKNEEVQELWKQEQNRRFRSAKGNQTVFRRVLEHWRWISINSWDAKEVNDGEPSVKKVDAKQLCETYNRLGFFEHRLYRFLLAAVIYLVLSILLMEHFDLPFRPYRGPLSWALDYMASYLSFSLQIILTFYVVDATYLCKKFITNLMKSPTLWPPQTCIKFEQECGLHRDYLDEWIDIRVIADRTRVVGNLIFYPFIGLFLIIVSRNSFFDRWDWPGSLILVLGLNSAYAIYALLTLRRATEKARHDAIESLNKKLLRVLGGEKKSPKASPATEQTGTNHLPSEKSGPKLAEKDGPKLAEQIRTLIQEIKDYEEGAFAPLSKNPVVGAVLMPFGGAGVVALLDHLAK